MYLEIVMAAALSQKISYKDFYMMAKLSLFSFVCSQVYVNLFSVHFSFLISLD